MRTLFEHNQAILREINRHMRTGVACDKCLHELWIYPTVIRDHQVNKLVVCNNQQCEKYRIIEEMFSKPDDST